jgi:hypothetical protein
MQAQPANRYQSADEMLVDLENVQRTVYKPAGQTELKRWLAELQERDHCPNISHAAPANLVPTIGESFDVGEGAEVVFDESSILAIDNVIQGIQPTVAATPTGQPPPPWTKPEGRTTASTPVAIKQNRIPGRIIVFALVLAALALGAWLAIPDGNRRRVKRVVEEKKPESPAVLVAKTEAPPQTQLGPVLDAGAHLGIDSGVLPGGGDPAAKATADNEEEEENLLKNAEPENNERVIDEEDAVDGHKKKASHKASAPVAAPISVRVVSIPEGAVISIGKRVFGRAPMNLRFRPGVQFQLTLVKKGYFPATKHFSVMSKNNRGIKVVLRKRPESRKPEAKKSLFHRIFGG